MICDLYKNQKVLNGLDLDKPIYKYIPLKYVLEMYKTKKLYMSKVKFWEDTYENFFLKQNFRVDGHVLNAKNLIEQVYGQSWTLINESDAMWRIYSNNQKLNEVAIKVKTTPSRLFDAIYVDYACMATTNIGQVQYMYKNELVTWLKNIQIQSATDFGRYIVPSMFMKRKPFSHESEVRVIVFLDNDMGNGIFYDIDPDIIFDEFVIDPRLEADATKKIIKKLLKVVADPKKIKQSTLYTFPPHIIKIG